jgi:hypothetical membrane protein
VPVRLAAICGLLAPVTYTAALLFGGLAQRDEFSSADDATSDLGADTASSPWIYNQIGTNLTGILIFAFALGLWRALSPGVLGRIGAALLLVQGVTLFLEGFFTLDCQGIDAACDNTSWHSEGHRWVSRFTAVCIFAAPLVLAFAFRRLPQWRDTWIPTLAAVPAFIAASIVFSLIGDGAATRAGAVVWFLWLGFVAFRLLQKSEQGGVRTAV